MSSGNQRVLGYESQKAIIRGLGVITRRGLTLSCPQIRNAMKVIPYKFGEVELHHNYYQFDNLLWLPSFLSGTDDIVDVCLYSSYSHKLVYEKTLKYKNGFFEQLLVKYLRPGTTIRKLYVTDAKFSNHGHLNVEEMKIDGLMDYSILKDIISIIHKKCSLKKLEIRVTPNSLDILDNAAVQNAECLVIAFEGNIPEIANKLMDFPNKTLIPKFRLFSVEQVYELAKKWISKKPEIGKKLIMPIHEYTFLCDVIDLFKSKFPGNYMTKVISLGDSWFANSLTVPVNEDAVLVVYGGETVAMDFDWSFRMEIMKKDDVIPQPLL